MAVEAQPPARVLFRQALDPLRTWSVAAMAGRCHSQKVNFDCPGDGIARMADFGLSRGRDAPQVQWGELKLPRLGEGRQGRWKNGARPGVQGAGQALDTAQAPLP